jgi:RNA polymerase sigma-70 factor, ECF subfamily
VSAFPERSRRADSSFERLYRRHRRDVYGAVLRDLRDPDEAEDVTQTAFMNAYRAMRRGEQPEKPRAWLVTIARNVCRRRYRSMATKPQEVWLDPEITAAVMDLEGPTAGEIAAAIRRLPENQRNAILLREIQGRSYAEIADALGLSLAAVETLIFRARRSLSEELAAAERAPTTQKRAARSLFALPLPGLGKLGSLGFSVSRAATAVLLGSAAIVVVPITDVSSGQANHARSVVSDALVREGPVKPAAAVHRYRAPDKPATNESRQTRKKGGATNDAPASRGSREGIAGLLPGVPGSDGTVPDAGSIVPDTGSLTVPDTGSLTVPDAGSLGLTVPTLPTPDPP